MEFLSIIFKWDDGFVPKRWVFGELKAKHNVTIIRHSKVDRPNDMKFGIVATFCLTQRKYYWGKSK